MEKIRCFIAIDLPDDVKQELVYTQNQLRLWPARVKWVEKNNFHLTLKFLGDVPLTAIPRISKSLEKISSRHLCSEVVLNSLGAFPNIIAPKIIWSGIRDLQGVLLMLRDDIEEGMAEIGFIPERKPFSAHLTLGRVKEGQRLHGLEELFKGIHLEDLVIPVREIKLMRSKLTSGGPEYSCINSFNLQEH